MAKAYEQAGVNIEAGYEAVSRMKKHVQKTMRPRGPWWLRWIWRHV